MSWTLFNYLCNEIKQQIEKLNTRLRCAIGFNNEWYTNNDHSSLDSEICSSNPAEGSATNASAETTYKECVIGKTSCYHPHYELYNRCGYHT